VFVDAPGHAADSTRDVEAGYRLEDAGWDVLRFPADADWDTIVEHNAAYFRLR
jgi:very-short-patch-repair endonuclease